MRFVVRYLVLLASIAAFAGAAYGIRSAALSPLFTLQTIEVTEAGAPSGRAGPAREAPVSSQAIIELASVPVGKQSLFEIDLAEVEKRILSHEWIRSVRLWKSFPETLSIEVTYRSPQAVFQSGQGALQYVDVDGRPFGRVSLSDPRDLPVLSGFPEKSPTRIVGALSLLGRWESASAARFSRISSLTWEPERGFRGLVVYPLGRSGTPAGFARTMLDFGQEIDAASPIQLQRIGEVLRYLGENAIPARQIWADSGKKIVVKTARGS